MGTDRVLLVLRAILFAEYSWSELDLVVVLAVNAGTHIWRSIKGGCRKCLEDLIRTDIMITVVMRHKDGS